MCLGEGDNMGWNEEIALERRAFFQTPTDIPRAFEYSKVYAKAYSNLIREKTAEASTRIFGTSSPPGVVVYAFGAPARNEMLGYSDADVAVYRSGSSGKELAFRQQLIDTLKPFNFTKIDTPVWGTLEDITTYAKTSVTEANQIWEAQFITGDPSMQNNLETTRRSAHDTQTLARNLLFQFLYFDQYYRRKKSADYVNLKYCTGGVRDLLFPAWYAQLRKGFEPNLRTTPMERGLKTLAEEGIIGNNPEEYLAAGATLSYIRDELMQLNPGDVDGRWNETQAEKMSMAHPRLFASGKEIEGHLNRARQFVADAKEKVRTGLCNYFRQTTSRAWQQEKNAIIEKETINEPPSVFENDDLLNMLRIWRMGVGFITQPSAYVTTLASSDSWTILASLLSHEALPGEIIDEIIRRRGCTKGYEYLLEIAGRNPQLQLKTVKYVLADTSVEPRFKTPALKRAKELGIW